MAVDGKGACLRSMNISTGTMAIFAGSCGDPGFADGTLMQARFDRPTDMAVRERDGSIFVADSGNSIIRWILPDLDSVSTLAGTQGSQGMHNGPAAFARFSNYLLLALIDEGPIIGASQGTRAVSDCPSLLVGDMGNQLLRGIKLDTDCASPSSPPQLLSPPAPSRPCSSARSCDCVAERWAGRVESAVVTALVISALFLFVWCVSRRWRQYSCSASHDPAARPLASDPLSQPLIHTDLLLQHSPGAQPMFALPREDHPSPVPADDAPCGDFDPESVSWAQLTKRVTPKESELREANQVFNEVSAACLKIEGTFDVKLAGSFAKGTAVCETSDLDLVVLFSDFDPLKYEHYLDMLLPALKELDFQEGQSPPTKGQQDSVHHYTFTLRSVSVDILVGGELPENHPDCLRNEPRLAIRRAWRPSCTPEAVNFICKLAEEQVYFRTTVRLAKYWRNRHVIKGKELGLSSTLIELLVAHALRAAERKSAPPQSISAAFSAFLCVIRDEGSNMTETWGMHSSKIDKPLLLAGPHDSTNNVAGAVKDWKELSKCAEQMLESLDKLGVVTTSPRHLPTMD